MQNANYADALEQGRAAAESIPDVLDAVMAIVRPVVECNRTQIDNGRTYLREMVFGDPEEPQHRDALAIVAQTEEAIADRVATRPSAPAGRRRHARAHRVRRHVPQHGGHVNIARSVDEILEDIRSQVRVLLPH